MTLGIYHKHEIKPEIGRWKAKMTINDLGLPFERKDLNMGLCPDEMWDTIQAVASEYLPVEESNLAYSKVF